MIDRSQASLQALILDLTHALAREADGGTHVRPLRQTLALLHAAIETLDDLRRAHRNGARPAFEPSA